MQGQTFEKPEVVPFRLTHNMIDAFGAYGYNGECPQSKLPFPLWLDLTAVA